MKVCSAMMVVSRIMVVLNFGEFDSNNKVYLKNYFWRTFLATLCLAIFQIRYS